MPPITKHLLGVKRLLYFIIFFPIICLAQFTITGRVLNQTNTKPLPNASVFLNNATIGAKTSVDGSFILRDVLPGKYELIVSIVGFETYSQSVIVAKADVQLPDISIIPKTIALKEVSVKFHQDPDRPKYYQWFKDEFLGASERAADCKIMNPELLDLSYDDSSHLLTATSVDFLEIENDALGYKIRYLLTNFSLETGEQKKIMYQGPALFEEMKGSPSQQRRWRKNREEVYENSPMHFLRAALADRLTDEGFRVQQFAIYTNPNRFSDSVISAKMLLYKRGNKRDSLSFWEKQLRLPKVLQKLLPFALTKNDIITTTDQVGQYALGCGGDGLYVGYSKNGRFHIDGEINYMYNRNNTENTLVLFNSPNAFFNSAGVILNPYSMMFYGVWGRNRIAELLPVDYEPAQALTQSNPMTKPFPAIDSALAKYLGLHPAEKAYLQLDKPYYAAGDTLYFKAYVSDRDSGLPSSISGILHVNLLGPDSKLVNSIKLKLDSGITWGDLSLPDSLVGGRYRLKAYTQLMRNDGQPAFFENVIEIGSSVKVSQAPSRGKINSLANSLPPDIQFFPEGGTLIAGVRSKIAFKALASNGLGIDVKGKIADSLGTIVASFASTHLGMGYFYLTPENGKTYYASVSYPDNSTAKVALPKPQNGIQLSIDSNFETNVMVTIAASELFFKNQKNREFKLNIYSGGTTATTIYHLDAPFIKLTLSTAKLRTGIAQFTLFSADDEPICERLLFIQNNDKLDIKVANLKKAYRQREKVRINLKTYNNNGPQLAGHFSASVINESVMPSGESNGENISSYMLLTSCLRGYIEQPGYYFSDTSSKAKNDLDVLLLTQGHRRFVWKNVLSKLPQPEKFTAEKAIEIMGRVTDLSGKPVIGGTVTMIPTKGGGLLTAPTDKMGSFRFSGLDFTDTAKFVLSAVDSKGKNLTKIAYLKEAELVTEASPGLLFQPPGNVDSAFTKLIANDKLQQQQVINYLQNKQIMLKEVKIKDKRINNQYETQSLAGAGHADQVLHSADLGSGPLLPILSGKLRGITFIADTPYLTLSLLDAIPNNPPKKMYVIIDGVPSYNVTGWQTTDIESVEVLKYASASMYGVAGAGGVLVITSKKSRGLNAKDIPSVGILPINPVGYYRAREFYSPKYDTPQANSQYRDMRSTIYWRPEIKTDKDGNASFEYFNADGLGTYKITIEGIDADGNLGRQVFGYKVE